MELALITMKKIVEMFLIMMTGVLAFKTGIVDSKANKHLSSLLLKIISPCLIFMSYQIDYQPERLKGLGIMVLLSFASYIWTILLVNGLIRPGSGSNYEIERFSSIYSNCGFIGVPLINAIVGLEGVFYMTAYVTVYNLFIWSHGLGLICGTTDFKKMLKNFVQPATIAILIGVVCFATNIRVPDVIGNPMTTIGNMNTPVAMMVAGCNLAEGDFFGILRKPRAYYVSAVKLLAVPIVSILILKFIPVDQIFITTILVALACPTGAMGTMLALAYNKNSLYATELFSLTTVLSLITIPFVILLMGIII